MKHLNKNIGRKKFRNISISLKFASPYHSQCITNRSNNTTQESKRDKQKNSNVSQGISHLHSPFIGYIIAAMYCLMLIWKITKV